MSVSSGEEARFKFLDGRLAGSFFRELMDYGYRRNGQFVYRPVCPKCRACEVLRVPVATFRHTREQRRIWNRGIKRFTVSLARPEYTEEKAAMYAAYLREIHGSDRGASVEHSHYASFLVHTCMEDQTYELHVRDEGKLVGLGIVDVMEDALSSVYYFYDPAYRRFSLGTFSMLAEIALARQLGLTQYYPGYYIAGCRAMNYKTKFGPWERRRLDETGWFREDDHSPKAGEGEKIVDNSAPEW